MPGKRARGQSIKKKVTKWNDRWLHGRRRSTRQVKCPESRIKQRKTRIPGRSELMMAFRRVFCRFSLRNGGCFSDGEGGESECAVVPLGGRGKSWSFFRPDPSQAGSDGRYWSLVLWPYFLGKSGAQAGGGHGTVTSVVLTCLGCDWASPRESCLPAYGAVLNRRGNRGTSAQSAAGAGAGH